MKTINLQNDPRPEWFGRKIMNMRAVEQAISADKKQVKAKKSLAQKRQDLIQAIMDGLITDPQVIATRRAELGI